MCCVLATFESNYNCHNLSQPKEPYRLKFLDWKTTHRLYKKQKTQTIISYIQIWGFINVRFDSSWGGKGSLWLFLSLLSTMMGIPVSWDAHHSLDLFLVISILLSDQFEICLHGSCCIHICTTGPNPVLIQWQQRLSDEVNFGFPLSKLDYISKFNENQGCSKRWEMVYSANINRIN